MSSNLFVYWMFDHEWVFDERRFYPSDKMKLWDEWSMDYVSLMITTLIHFRNKLVFPLFLGMNYEKGCFFPSILWYSHSCNHPQEEELAKFVYRLERKVEKFKNSAIFWWLVEEPTYCLNKPSSENCFLKRLWLIFFTNILLYKVTQDVLSPKWQKKFTK
jgi:hypothetical protein